MELDLNEIRDVDDLKAAIRLIGRRAGSDQERRTIIGRATALDASDLLPDAWTAGGALTADARAHAWDTQEKRDTANDVFMTLDGAIDDAFGDQFSWCWVQDWYGSGDDDNPYTVVYTAGGDLWAAAFSYDDDGKATVDPDSARKVRPLTQYIDRAGPSSVEKRNKALRANPRLDSELRAARDSMRGLREERRMPTQGFEMREVARDDGDGSWVVCSGYASRTCADMNDDSNAYEMEDAFGPWVESTVRGFAAKTIREGCDTAFLVNHTGVTMARTKAGTLSLDERLDGLFYEGQLNPIRPDVQILRAAVQDGAVDESSFAFRVIRQKWSDDYTRRWIQEVTLDKGDVSPVNYGANPHTADAELSMRSKIAAQREMSVAMKRSALFRELLAGRSLCARDIEALGAAVEAFQEADDADPVAISRALQLIDEALSIENEPSAPAPAPAPIVSERSFRELVIPDYTLAARVELEQLRRAA